MSDQVPFERNDSRLHSQFDSPLFNESIRDVWVDNFETEISRISEVVERFPYVAFDTEFPGVVIQNPQHNDFDNYGYQKVKVNVNSLKIIQLGLTFCDEDGNLATPVSTWQFNFAFDLASDKQAKSSIDLLKDSGIDFEQHKLRGIDPNSFAERIITTGLVLSEQVTWICFHGCYDFAYMLRLLQNCNLPPTKKEFDDVLKIFFPVFYDIKTFQHEI